MSFFLSFSSKMTKATYCTRKYRNMIYKELLMTVCTMTYCMSSLAFYKLINLFTFLKYKPRLFFINVEFFTRSPQHKYILGKKRLYIIL